MSARAAKRPGRRFVEPSGAKSAESAKSTKATGGPQNCLRTVQPPANCPACGALMVTVRHMPIRMAGTYCRLCCPCCREVRVPASRSIPSGGAVTP
jgi:hypothetical protein